ncbi:hypothetical protein DPSP01_004899 [Paraphaeosphaeria sporulosa]|uniref:Uncharacterized protein n=1 Tax=Paraphaeosphaeria sporulosa TaxID=1460663 RepID=A0A177C902_9PLEO|nr:uncharacterized protein CC84DRAFT_1220119 [Paraphaeosphaeria sporulosa]OAG03237.1 hypothetical protein CC84DRAFT_1220119 [Paraphaeosphaeria sporulosa]
MDPDSDAQVFLLLNSFQLTIKPRAGRRPARSKTEDLKKEGSEAEVPEVELFEVEYLKDIEDSKMWDSENEKFEVESLDGVRLYTEDKKIEDIQDWSLYTTPTGRVCTRMREGN